MPPPAAGRRGRLTETQRLLVHERSIPHRLKSWPVATRADPTVGYLRIRLLPHAYLPALFYLILPATLYTEPTTFLLKAA